MASKNPFDDDDDFNPAYNGSSRPPNDELNFYQQQIGSSLNESLASTQRSLQLLNESEETGTATAQDLITQGEKLRKTDQRLDEISATTKETQKHLTGIKSIFGGMKNYFRGDPKAKNPSAADTSAAGQTPTGGKLDATVNQLKSADSYGEEKKIMKKSDTSGSVKGDAKIPSLQGTQWQDVDTEIDQNLDLMGAHLARIRSLGLALGEEVDTQNQLIDNITVKAQKADAVIRDQDKQMLKIMGGGKKK